MCSSLLFYAFSFSHDRRVPGRRLLVETDSAHPDDDWQGADAGAGAVAAISLRLSVAAAPEIAVLEHRGRVVVPSLEGGVLVALPVPRAPLHLRLAAGSLGHRLRFSSKSAGRHRPSAARVRVPASHEFSKIFIDTVGSRRMVRTFRPAAVVSIPVDR